MTRHPFRVNQHRHRPVSLLACPSGSPSPRPAGTFQGREVAVMEALTGQVFLATLVARLVAAFRTSGDGQNAPDDRQG